MTRRRAPGASGRSVSSRLTSFFATLVVLLVAVGATGAFGLVVSGHHRDRALRIERLRDANTAMLLAMTNAETGVRGYRLAQDRAFLEPYDAGRASFTAAVEHALRNADDAGERALIARQVGVADQWFQYYAEPVAAMPPGEVVVSEEHTLVNKRVFDRYRAVNAGLDASTSRRYEAAQRTGTMVGAGALTLTVLAVGLALLLALVMHRRTRRALEPPLRGVVAVLESLADGDHAARADAGDGPEEVRVLARTVNELADESDRLREGRATAARAQRLAVEIGRGIRDSAVADDPVQDAITQLGEALGVDRVYVRVLARDDAPAAEHEWHQPRLAPLEEDARSALAHDAVSTWAQDRYQHGEPFVVPDLQAVRGQDPGLDHVADRTGATAVLVVPIGAGNRSLGVLGAVVHTGAWRWADHELSLARSVAADLGRSLVLAGLFRQQERLVTQLRELDSTKSTFLATVSHELRTPLTNISGYVEMIRDGDAGPVSAEADAMLAVIDRNSARLKSLIEDLLTLSSIEAGAFKVVRGDIVLADVVDEVGRGMRPAAEDAQLVLEVLDGAPGAVVRADRGQLRRALGNLVSNAIKFTPPGGRVVLRTTTGGGCVQVEVSDNGIGIPRQEQDALFSRFFRATNATDLAIQGIGLGLTIVRTIVEHHDGDLAVRSAEGEGTTVTLRLPLAGAAAPTASTLPVQAAPPAGGSRLEEVAP